jgi:hypothetical protein
VGDPPLVELVGLHFGLPSDKDNVSCKLHQLLCSSFFLVLMTWYLFHTSIFYFGPLVMVEEGAEYVCLRKFGHLLCCGLCFLFFQYVSLCLLCTFSSEWSKCIWWGSVIVTGSDMLFDIFQSANVEIICFVDYFSCYCCCC